jgi:hypothetical protein
MRGLATPEAEWNRGVRNNAQQRRIIAQTRRHGRKIVDLGLRIADCGKIISNFELRIANLKARILNSGSWILTPVFIIAHIFSSGAGGHPW